MFVTFHCGRRAELSRAAPAAAWHEVAPPAEGRPPAAAQRYISFLPKNGTTPG